MAVLTGITGAVRANIAGAAQRAVKSAAEGVKSIAGLNPEGSNSALGTTANLMGGQSSSVLAYPINVDNDEQQGHYILFHINSRSNGKLLVGDKRKDMSESVKKIEKEIGIKDATSAQYSDFGSVRSQQIASLGIAGPKIAKVEGANNAQNRSILLSKLPTTRLEKSIALYMPPNVQVSYEIKYADKEIGSLALAGSAAIEAFKNEGGDTKTKLRAAADAAGVAGQEGLTNFFNKALDGIASGAEALSQIEKGSVITPRMEMMFEGVGRRSFSYTFSFIPKSKQEAGVVEDIIKHFKFYAMPAYSNPETRREMDIPGTFDIEYMYRGSRNNFINRISTCFLTKVDVQYGGDRYTAYEEIPGKGPPPQKSSLTLNFTELETLSQSHIGDGY